MESGEIAPKTLLSRPSSFAVWTFAVRTFAVRAGALVLLILPFVPPSLVLGHDLEDSSPIQSVCGLVIVFAASFILGFLPAGAVSFITRFGQTIAGCSRRTFLTAALGVLATTLCLISLQAYSQSPLYLDSVVQLFQAKIFAGGALVAPLPKHLEFFMVPNMLFDERGWYSQYPPLHSALLAFGVLLNTPWMVPIVLAVLTALVLYFAVLEIYDELTARVSLVLLLVCPFFLFMSASFMNHVSTLLFLSLALWTFARWEKRLLARHAFFCGVSLGCAMLVRPFCAFTEGAVLACCALKTLRERNCLRHAACGLFGVTLTASVLLFYNHFTTGNALLPGYIKLWGESHGLGFHQTPWGEFHTPLRGLRNEFTNLVLLHAMLFEWPIPSCLLLALAMLFGLLPSRWDRRLFFSGAGFSTLLLILLA